MFARKFVQSCLVAAILVVVFSVHSDAASFQGLGDLPGGGFDSGAKGISADGLVVVGTSASDLGSVPFRWSASTDMVGLGLLQSSGIAHGTSADGSVIVGSPAFRWTEATGRVSLGFGPTATSADGSVIVGTKSPQAIRWTESTGAVDIGHPTYAFDVRASGVSADGTVIVGSTRSNEGVFEAYRWTEADGFLGLRDLRGGIDESAAIAVSGDGLVVVGHSNSELGEQAFRWTETDGMVALDDLSGSGMEGIPWAVNYDGSVIVGQVNAGSFFTFIWTEQTGMLNLQEYLENDIGLDLTGWTLTDAQGISADGTAIEMFQPLWDIPGRSLATLSWDSSGSVGCRN